MLCMKNTHSYRSNSVDSIRFRCPSCRNEWEGEASRVEDMPERSHPFAYFDDCPKCEIESPQIYWEIGLFSRWAMATGPKTAEGKAKSAANLDGHPTPEEAKRTRYNAMKHGLTARQAKFFPAKPGKYPHCESCDVDWGYCSQQTACLKRTELFMKYHMAFENQDPDLLRDLHADTQAGVGAMLEDMLISILSDGVTLKSPQYGFDKDGGMHLARYKDELGQVHTIEDVKAHPLLKVFGEYLTRNNLSMADMNMTPKVQTDQGIQMGNLADEGESKETLKEVSERQTLLLGQLKDQISRSKKRLDEDPVLLEHKTEESESSGTQ